eukprot:s772_g4.t1
MALHQWRMLIGDGPPRPISLLGARPADFVIFTDGSFPDGRSSLLKPWIGGVLFKRGMQPIQFGCEVSSNMIARWLPRKSQIAMVELFATVIALETFKPWIRDSWTLLFVDSEPVQGALVKGYSAKEDLCELVGVFWKTALELQVSATDALRAAMKEAEEVKAPYKEPDERTKRMVQAIGKDDFEECEDAIMQGADVNADCGAGMCALHISALRGEIFLTELLIAHGANINQRDMSGNTPLLYACHFYRQHGRGVQLCAQLLFHKADPHFRVKDGKLAGKSALDLMDKACNEPNTDENVPRQMKAMLQLALEGSEACLEAITKMWVSIKSQPQNKKLFQVSSKKDNFDYAMKSIDWADELKSGYAPVKLDVQSDRILEEKFTILKDYLFNDEGDKVKVYVTFPEGVPVDSLGKENLDVSFEYQAFDLKLRTANESFRLRIEPLFGSIDVDQCKHRASQGSRKVTLTLTKRHKNRTWTTLQKAR